MTAPELVEVVAAALDTHVRIKSQTLHQECLCGWVGKVLGYDHPAHQARAVLAALTEAGEVEWGVENGHTPIDHVTDAPDQTFAALRCRARQGRGVPARVVSRLTLPWTAVGE